MHLRAAAFLSLLLATAGCDSCEKKPEAQADAGPTLVPDAAPLNATPVPTASVAKLLNPDGLPAYNGPTGSIEGTVVVRGPEPPKTPADFSKCPAAEHTYGTSFRVGQPRDDGARPIADAIVVVTGYSGFFVPEKEEATTATIEGCAYTKRTVTMTYGQRLEVKNTSDQLWGPTLEPSGGHVVMMATPKGDPVKIYPPKPGHYLLLDRNHSWAVTDVYAFLHPLHASTDLAGSYRIDGVPVGTVKVNATHPRFESADIKEVEIRPGEIAKVDLVLHYESPDAGKVYDAGPRPVIH